MGWRQKHARDRRRGPGCGAACRRRQAPQALQALQALQVSEAPHALGAVAARGQGWLARGWPAGRR